MSFLGEIKEDLLNQDVIDKLHSKLDTVPTLMVFGQNCHAKALFVNNLLDQVVLPLFSSQWRHVS